MIDAFVRHGCAELLQVSRQVFAVRESGEHSDDGDRTVELVGDLGQVLSTSDEPRVVRWREARLARAGGDADALAARVRAAVPSDPLALAPHVDARRLLLGLTRLDDDVPYASQLRLCDALGRPERFTLPTGHASAALALPYLVSRATGFLEERLRASGQ